MNIAQRIGENTGSQSVDRALALLSVVGRHAERGVSLTEIVATTDLNKPTARRLLLALIRAGLVEQDEETRLYFLGEESFVLGSLASRRYGLLQLAMDGLVRLSRRTEDASFLSIRRGANSVCLYREEGSFPVRTHALQAGFEHPLGVGAGSLAMLAALPDDEVEAVLATNAEVLRQRYPMLSPERIRQDVAATRLNGFSLNPGLIYPNSWGVGVAIRASDGGPAGALSVAAIDSRLQPARQTEIAGYLAEEARLIEKRLADMHRSARTNASTHGRTST